MAEIRRIGVDFNGPWARNGVLKVGPITDVEVDEWLHLDDAEGNSCLGKVIGDAKSGGQLVDLDLSTYSNDEATAEVWIRFNPDKAAQIAANLGAHIPKGVKFGPGAGAAVNRMGRQMGTDENPVSPHEVARRGLILLDAMLSLGEDEELAVHNRKTGKLERLMFKWKNG